MRRYLLLVLGIVLSLSQTWAQSFVQITTGTAGTPPAYNAGPIYRSSAASAYDASRYAYLYTPDELAAVGIANGDLITDLGWMKNNTGTTTGGGIFRIYMKNSGATTYGNATETWVNLSSGSSLVYENLNEVIPATANPAYINFALNSPFIYTGGSIEILTEWDINQVSGSPSTGTLDWMWSTVVDRIYGTGQTVLANAGTLSATTNSISTIDNRRPFLQIGYVLGTNCSGIPNGGTANTSQAAVCPGIAAGLSVSGASIGAGLVYQWQSSPDGFVWTDMVGFTGSVASPIINSALSYRRRIICTAGPDTAYSTPVFVDITPFFNCYCTSSATSTIDSDIQQVIVGSFVNTSLADCDLYTDFTSITPPNLIQGLSYDTQVDVGDCNAGTSFANSTAIFIDFNQNGLFTDPGEKVTFTPLQPATPVNIHYGNFTVPVTAVPGITRMRIIAREAAGGDVITPCGTYTYGETEDYLVNILPPPANEAGVLAITKPEIAACSLGQQIWVDMQNLGSDTLTSATFSVSVSGFALPPVNWTGVVLPQSTQEVQIPITYVLADGDSVSVTVSSPNGAVEDPLFAFNNQTGRRVWAGMTGIKTVYGVGADFVDVNAAVDALEIRGVCDTVFFKIASGSYTSQHTLVSYPGAGIGKLAVFESATGNPADVSFTHSAAAAADNFVFSLDGGDGYMIRNLTARATGTAFSNVITILNGADNNIIENNILVGDTAAAYATGDFNRIVVASTSGTGDIGTIVRNNHIIGGNRGLNLGGATGAFEGGNVVEGNLIEKYGYIGAIFGTVSNPTITGNTFRPRTDLTGEAFGAYVNGSINGGLIAGNDYVSYRPGSGIFLANVKGGMDLVEVLNNFVFAGDSSAAGVSRGILIQDVNTSGVLVANNSISYHSDNLSNGAITVLDGSQIQFFNNNVGAFGAAPAVRIEKSYSVSASDNNNVFGSTVANLLGSTYTTLAAFQAASSTDAASVSVNPGFNGTDLHTCAPELNGAAAVLSAVTVDFDGDPRSTMPDIGADEFVGDANALLAEDEFLKCPSDVVTIGNTALNGVTYSWTPSGSTSEISTSNAGTFVVTAASSCGSFSDTAVVVNKPLPDAAFSSTTVGLTAIFTNTSTNGSSYLWDFGDGNTSTDFSPTHVYETAATYSVTLTVTNDCGTDTFGPVSASVLNVSIEENELASVSLFPNPTNGAFNVTMNNMGADASVITVIDVTGKTVMVKNVPAGENQVTLDATGFASGIYSVKITNGLFSKVIRLVRK